jgi:hypothetical protein
MVSFLTTKKRDNKFSKNYNIKGKMAALFSSSKNSFKVKSSPIF